MVWPHVKLLLDQISSLVRQPLAIQLYVAFLLFEGAVSALIGTMSSGKPQLSITERQRLLPRLRRLMLRRGAIAVAAVTGTEIGVGILGSFIAHAWSLDNMVVGLLIIGITASLLVPVIGVMYAVWRLYLMRNGHFVPSE